MYNKTTHPFVSITILSFDRQNDLQGCLESLYRFTDYEKTPFEVILVDQGSNAETLRYLKSLSYPHLKAIFLKDNIGCARGRNMAIDYCSQKSRFIFQADNDIIFSEGWLNRLCEHISTHHQIGALQAKVVKDSGEPLSEGGWIERFTVDGTPSETGYIAYLRSKDTYRFRKQYPSGIVECDYISGGATLFRTECLMNCRLEEEFLNGYEDIDLSLRLRQNGWKLGCDYNVMLTHHSRLSKDAKFQKEESRYIAARENPETLFASLCALIRRYDFNPIRSTVYDRVITDSNNVPFYFYTDKALKAFFDGELHNTPI